MTTFMKRCLVLILLVLVQFVFISPQKAFAATSPSLGNAESYSVISHTNATNTGITTVSGNFGDETGAPANAGTLTVGGSINPAVPSVADAQLANTAAFTAINQTCTVTYSDSPHDLVGSVLVPGVYCADSFSLTGTLTLSGGAGEVYIFKSASTLVTSGTANVVGGDPCNIWWRIGSSATLGTDTSLIGNILALASIQVQTRAGLNGRAFVQTANVTLDSNTITASTCVAAPVPPTPLSCSGDEHLDAGGVNCVTFSVAGPSPESGAVTSTGQVLGASTLGSTGTVNSKLGIMLMLLGTGITLISFYALKKNSL